MEVTEAVPPEVAQQFGLSVPITATALGAGHIHTTLLVQGTGGPFVLQKINTSVFKKPEAIAHNLSVAGQYLAHHHPDYFFLNPIPTQAGQPVATDSHQHLWRLLPYVRDSFTLEEIDRPEQAYEAARGFGLLARYLDGLDPHQLQPTIDRFHDLGWRYEQFETACARTTPALARMAEAEISSAKAFQPLVAEYQHLIQSGGLKLRVTHSDTKINNVLFDRTTNQVKCVIDLDTLMPGYFTYDLGDLVRTCVCPVNEEETDLSQITIRKEVYEALVAGYLHAMGDVLSDTEKTQIPFAGRMMTYIMALRFLADHLNGNVYYKVKYPRHNLDRARNQLHVLEKLM
jgi:Ser/Thr protein kinase RdoA (MazF antagonist)